MAAGSAAERAEAKGRASARKRGREVCVLVSHPFFCLALCLCSQVSFLHVHAGHKYGPLPVCCKYTGYAVS